MNNINNNIENRIYQLNKKIDNLVSLVDKQKFYNNIFFEVNSKPVPLNLINTDYININNNKKEYQDDKNIINEENSINNPIYLLKEPNYIFSLPSSDDSGNEDNNKIKQPSFKSICEEIIDTDTLEIIHISKLTEDKSYKEEINKNLNESLPILMFKRIAELSSINEIKNILKNKIFIKPYEIKRTFFPLIKNDIFLIKFFSLNDAIKVKQIFEQNYTDNNFHLCYDNRELKNSKWYCVIFRREFIKDKNNYKFNDIITDIFDKIKCKKKLLQLISMIRIL